MEPALVGVFIPIVAIVGGLAVGAISILAAHRKRALQMELRHKERLVALERGLELPPDVDPALDPKLVRPRHLLRGLVWTFVGLAAIGFFYNESGPDEAWLGGLPLAVGLAYLLYYVLEGRREAESVLGQTPPAA